MTPQKKSQHGGARAGAGRKSRNGPTVVKRIPQSIVPIVDDLIERVANQIEESDTRIPLDAILLSENLSAFSIPLAEEKIPAGFPNPAEPYIADYIDFNAYLISNPAATFAARSGGLSMFDAGIDMDDILIIDRSVTPKHRDIVMADLGKQVRMIILHYLPWKGLPTCVGIAPTKTLAKFCNHLAKRHSNYFGGVVVWTDWNTKVQQRALASEPVSEVWGIGRRTAEKLSKQGIQTALDFVTADSGTIRKKYGVTIERVQRELQGLSCDNLQIEIPPKKQLIRNRSFGQSVTGLEDLQAAVTHHISSAGAALRKENTRANFLNVFIMTNRFKENEPQYYGYKQTAIIPSNDTFILNRTAQALLKDIYKRGYQYKKCGVELGGIEPASDQISLWGDIEENKLLMSGVDRIQERFGRHSIFLASEALGTHWKMNRNILSPAIQLI